MTRLCAFLFLSCLLMLAGCASGSMRRDLDVSGELPRALGLGAFAPNCVFLCFPTATVTQGDVVREDIPPGEAYRVIEKTEAQVNQRGFKVKPKPPPKSPPPKAPQKE